MKGPGGRRRCWRRRLPVRRFPVHRRAAATALPCSFLGVDPALPAGEDFIGHNNSRVQRMQRMGELSDGQQVGLGGGRAAGRAQGGGWACAVVACGARLHFASEVRAARVQGRKYGLLMCTCAPSPAPCSPRAGP